MPTVPTRLSTMPGRIVRSDIDAVRERTDIAAVIGEYVTLKRAGVGSLKGLCPFHEERTPSFNVRPQAGFYHCFGCGEGGDVFTFLEKIGQMSFTDAVEMLASRIGYQLHYESGDGAGDADAHAHRARLLQANAAAADFFRESLESPEGAAAREMLMGRSFDKAAAERFGVGYAPRGWDGLRTRLRALGFTDEECLAAGVVTQGSRGVYDRFRGRVIWPIRDVTGQTVGFGARLLYPDDKGPKYLNTPETVLYRKSNVLYGLDLARREIANRRQVVVVEGYTDVMACHLAGVTTAVAACGTAFGAGHIQVLRRILGDAPGRPVDVVFTFDPDAAGRKAALRAFAEESKFVAQTYVAISPGGLDPCDLRIERGDQAVRSMVDARRPLFEFAIRQVLVDFDLDTVEGRVGALRATAPIVAGIKDPAVRPAYVRRLAGWVGVEVSEAESAVRAATSGGSGERRTTAVTPSMPPATDPVVRMERQLIEVLLQCPEALPVDLRDRVGEVHLSQPMLSRMLDAIVAVGPQSSHARLVEEVIEALPDEFAPQVRAAAVEPLPVRDEAGVAPYARGLAVAVLDMDITRRKAELTRALGRLDGTASLERRRLETELEKLEHDRRSLRGE